MFYMSKAYKVTKLYQLSFLHKQWETIKHMSQTVTVGGTGAPNELTKPATQDQKLHYFAIFRVVVTGRCLSNF